MIQIQDLRIDYEDLCAVQNLSLEIGPGEVFGLIGPNGAGKTTTLRALMGLQAPTYGRILLNGIDVQEKPDEARRWIGFMPDYPALYEDLTVWEFLDLFAASYQIPPAERQAAINYCLELVDLTEKRNAFTAGLSRGMKQRVMLAKTLIPNPQIILLDEPANGLDPHGRVLLRNLLRQLGEEGRVVVISSHILTELSDFCTSAGIMEKGRMVLSGRVEEITQRILGQGEIVVEVLSGEAALGDLVATFPGAGKIRRDGNTFTFPLDGGPEEASDLLARLVSAGVRIASFARKRETLEEVFMRVGAREVS